MKSAGVKILVVILLSIIQTFCYGQKIRTIAGNGLFATSYGSGDGGPARSASFGNAFGIAVDSAGNVFVTDNYYNVIRKIKADGTISTICGNGVPFFSGDGGPASAAKIQAPYLMVSDAAGNIYFADAGNKRIRKIDTFGIITTVAGNGNGMLSYSGDNGQATNAAIGSSSGICFDRLGNMYIGDGNSRVRKVSPSGVITTLAGNGFVTYGGDGGPATAASIDGTGGLAADTALTVYFSDRNNSEVRKVKTSGIISALAGIVNSPGGTGDGGIATNAKVNFSNGVKVDVNGNIFIVDQGNNRIRKVNATTGIITNFAGSPVGAGGYAGDGGPPTAAKFTSPTDICFGTNGKIYICDKGPGSSGTGGRRIREIFYVDTFHITANPGTVLCGTALATFAAHPRNAYYSFSYQWAINGVPAGTNSPNYAPAVLHDNDIITCSLIDTANGGMLLAVSDTIQMTIQPPILPQVFVTSSGDTVCAGETVTLSATAVNGGSAPHFDWFVFSAPIGTGPILSYIPNVGDIVTCVLTSSDPCALPHTTQVTRTMFVNPSYHPDITLLTVPGSTITYLGEFITMFSTVTYGGSSPTFQWYEHNMPIPGATSSSYFSEIYTPDTFYCVVHSNAICVVPSIDTSNYVYIGTGSLGVENVSDNGERIGLYPNPNTGSFILKGSVSGTADGSIGIEVKNLLGQSVFRKSATYHNNKIDQPVQLGSDQPPGMYFLITSGGSNASVIPFMVGR